MENVKLGQQKQHLIPEPKRLISHVSEMFSTSNLLNTGVPRNFCCKIEVSSNVAISIKLFKCDTSQSKR